MIFYDGIAHKIDDVEFVIPEDDYCKPWKFTSSDGRFEMDFLPILDRSACLDYKLIVSDQHQVFGRMSGMAVLDDGTKIEILWYKRIINCALSIFELMQKEFTEGYKNNL